MFLGNKFTCELYLYSSVQLEDSCPSVVSDVSFWGLLSPTVTKFELLHGPSCESVPGELARSRSAARSVEFNRISTVGKVGKDDDTLHNS
jgi:hypothetical protein